MRRALILSLRYFLFGLLVISNAIICSVAVWNLSLAQAAGYSTPQVDVYMIFLGAFALAFMLPLIFVDILWKYAFSGRVWFECAWTCSLLTLTLSGAAAVTAILPSSMCNANVITPIHSCTSTRLLQAFSWTSAISLFIYFFSLVLSAVAHQKIDKTIWHASVRAYPWYHEHLINSNPASPTLPKLPSTRNSLVQPKPLRPFLTINTQNALQSQYKVEHLPAASKAERPIPPIPAAPPAQRIVQETRQVSNEMPSLYPHHLESSWTYPSKSTVPPPEQAVSPVPSGPSTFAVQPSSSTSLLLSSQSSQEPPPLGNWPRADVMKTPVSRRDSRKPPSSFTAKNATSPASADVGGRGSSDSDRSLDSVMSSGGSPRPLGGRPSKRMSEMRRPPPLDLSRLSNGRTSLD